jgi:hypothetical protein
VKGAAPAGEFADYSVKNYKPFASPDGGGFNVTLYRGTQRIANVHNGGYGGCFDWHWLVQDEATRLAAHVATLPEEEADLGGKKFTYKLDIDAFVDKLISDHVDRKALRALIKKFAFVTGKEVRYMRPGATADAARAFIQSKYPSAVILGDMPEDQALELYRSLASN